jgi:hypothetical protein
VFASLAIFSTATFDATRAIRQAEVGAAKTMIDRTEQRLGLKPQRLPT